MLITFMTAVVVSLAANWLVRSVAHENGWLSKPRSPRHIHLHPVPRLGGVGVFVSFIVMTAIAGILKPEWLPAIAFMKLLIPATVMFGVGLWDDLRPVSPKVKLLFQVICGGALFLWMRQAHLGGSLGNGKFDGTIMVGLCVVWVVIVCNSINLVDGVDGLAGGTAVLALAAIAWIAWCAGQGQIAYLAVILIASTLGFLWFNIHPATMFLGDGGSLFLGFMISAFGAAWSTSHSLKSTFAVTGTILALPLTETVVSIFRRFLNRRSMFASDREHMHHKLLERGLTQRRVAYVLCSIAAVSGVAGIAMAFGSTTTFLLGVSTVVVVLTAGVVALGYEEFAELARITRKVIDQRRIVANNVVLRKIAMRISKTACMGSLGNELQIALNSIQFDGFELSLTPWFVEAVPCEIRSAMGKWGTFVETRLIDSSCWSIGIDLYSERTGNLGRIKLTRTVDKGPLLFDVNVIVETLQPAIVTALEQCLSAQCHQNQAWVKDHPRVWSPSPTKLPIRIAVVSDSSNSAIL
jgi:UDP-GlcNAc:undecaprenyl-phosphate GlcNAc-1-phosphate transferase